MTGRREAIADATSAGGSESLANGTFRRHRVGAEHVTIAVSGAHGGHTVDFRALAAGGMTLLGLAGAYENGVMQFAPDLRTNIENGDANYLSMLDEADAYIARNGLDLPEEPRGPRLRSGSGLRDQPHR